MSELKSSISQLVNDLDTLRPYVLSGTNNDDAELRSILRRMLSQLESLQRAPLIAIDKHQFIVSLFSRLLDAEHGALLKASAQGALSSDDSANLDAYVTALQSRLRTSEQDVPAIYKLILRCSNLLGKPPDNKASDVSKLCKHLELQLREHLQDDASLRVELNQLTSAFESSLNILTDILQEVGGNTPELQRATEILKKDLPSDPKKAHEVLQFARLSLTEAGEKIHQATTTLKENIQQQMSQVHHLSRCLEDAESQARSDPLTGLANRRKLAEFLSSISGKSSCFVMLDIDHFKHVNDTYGHDAGDEILTELSTLLTASVRDSDMVARLGGEEFCIVLAETDPDQAFQVAEKIREAVEMHPFQTHEGKIEITISLGVAKHRDDESHAVWLKRADQALYQSKDNGRNRVTMIQ